MGCSDSKSTNTSDKNGPGGKMVLHQWPGSAPCRAVFLTIGALNCKDHVDCKKVDLLTQENKQEAFLKINPNGKVPTLQEGSFILWESRAIMKYLCSKFPKESATLYPEDLEKRAEIDKLLMFDQSPMYASLGEWLYPQILFKQAADEELEKKLTENLEKVNTILEGKTYWTGNDMTLVDLSAMAGITLLELLDYDLSKYANIEKWKTTMKSLPYYDKCNEGLEMWKGMVKGGGQEESKEE